MKTYKVIKIYEGNEEIIKSGLSLTEAYALQKELIIKYADSNTSYEIR